MFGPCAEALLKDKRKRYLSVPIANAPNPILAAPLMTCYCKDYKNVNSAKNKKSLNTRQAIRIALVPTYGG